MEDVRIEIIERATQELAQGLTALMPQLLTHPVVVNMDKLALVIGQPGVKLFVALLGDKVVGTAQLTIYERTYAPVAWVDGVIVDSEERGKGIATTLMQAVIQASRELGLREVNLTSNPSREAANHLYTKLGFEKYDTNYYRYRF